MMVADIPEFQCPNIRLHKKSDLLISLEAIAQLAS